MKKNGVFIFTIIANTLKAFLKVSYTHTIHKKRRLQYLSTPHQKSLADLEK